MSVICPIFPDSPCVCSGGYSDCSCPQDERALRNISSGAWPHGPMTAEQRQWCVDEADRAAEGAMDTQVLSELPDRDLASDTLNAWWNYARSNVEF